jgi:hypothetical protein
MNWEKHNVLLLLAAMALMLASITVGAKDNTTGSIKGQVNYCSQGGYVGMQVFIPGRQFMAFLGQDGNFIFEGVPAGSFALNYLVNGKLVHETSNVSVAAGKTMDLGVVAFCDKDAVNQAETVPAAAVETSPEQVLAKCESSPGLAECQDVDKDGVIALQDCNDNAAAIHPGADELCDGIDNNCDGRIDEALQVKITNGVGLCKNSVVSVESCNKGFADCDKNPATGCETDIFNDNDNCGACGNECSALEICRLGIC